MAFKAFIVGIPNIPSIKEVNIRAEPNKSTALLFKIPVGTGDLNVVDVKIDNANESQAGKVFQWFKLVFPDGQQGWCRDDLLEVQGDGKQFGYGQVTSRTLGFNLTRQQVQAPAAAIPVPVSQPPPAKPVSPAVTAQPSSDTTEATMICMFLGGANVRPGPGISTGGAIMRIDYLAEAKILGVDKSRDPNDPFTWINVEYQGRNGWMREDLVRLKGNYEQYGLAFHDMYPSPAPDSWWARDFNHNAAFNPILHDGWDHSGKIGVPIIGGPKGGLVIKTAICAKCGANGSSSVDKGYAVSDSRVLSDPGWNYGYGNYVNVRYHHDLLPASVQKRLADMGKAGWHIFVNHAHLHSISVQANQEFGPNAELGKMGNSGNSTGPHLHLEVRAHPDPNEKEWYRMKAGLMSPAILFLR